MRTILYIDGFNLYYRALRERREFRWLNVQKLGETLLFKDNNIETVHFFTARVDNKMDADAVPRQDRYLLALNTLPNLHVHYGNFSTRKLWAKLAQPPRFKPEHDWQHATSPETVRIIKSEEKGSDVNLAVQLVKDGFQNKFDVAAVITNDTDLENAIKTVTQDIGKPVVLLSPVERPARVLREAASTTKIIRPTHLRKSQFPDTISLDNGRSIQKPVTWV